jgi:hypothetical protein
MKIYIASSWKNQHGVEMLTALLREKGHEVVSWIENSYDEQLYVGYENMSKWIQSENGAKAFDYDTYGASTCDLMIFTLTQATMHMLKWQLHGARIFQSLD